MAVITKQAQYAESKLYQLLFNAIHVIKRSVSSQLQILVYRYSRLSLSRSRWDSLKHFEISVLQHIRCVELRKMPTEQSNFTNEHVI